MDVQNRTKLYKTTTKEDLQWDFPQENKPVFTAPKAVEVIPEAVVIESYPKSKEDFRINPFWQDVFGVIGHFIKWTLLAIGYLSWTIIVLTFSVLGQLAFGIVRAIGGTISPIRPGTNLSLPKDKGQKSNIIINQNVYINGRQD